MSSLRAWVIVGLILIGQLAWSEEKAENRSAALDPNKVRQQLDRVPVEEEKPFAPADGAQVKLNPPAFVWLPLAKYRDGYVLAISRNPDFTPAETMLVKQLAISVHIPTATLTPGRWHWRVGVPLEKAEMVWGRTRTFTIDPKAEVWPFPDVAKLIAKVPQSHPRLFFPGEHLAEARRQTKSSMSKEYRDVCRRAEGYLGQPLIAEPERLPTDSLNRGRVYAQIIRETRPPMDQMEACALAYVLSGERRFGEEAKRRLLHFFAWDPDGTTSLFYNDEPAMWVMQRGTRAYDWTYDLFTPAEREQVERAMRVRAGQFFKRLSGMPFESRPYSSHPARDVGFLGEVALSFAHEWPEARDWLRYVLSIYWSVYPAWAEDDGGWQEGPSYWAAYMSFSLHFATALKQATDTDMLRKPFFRNTPYFKLYTNPPYARMSPFGDSQDRGPGRVDLLDHFGLLLNDPYLRWYLASQTSSHGTDAMSFALASPTPAPKAPTDLPQARVFPGAGLVAMHANLADPTRNAYLVLRSSPFGSISHGHADQNAFAIEAFGEALAIASGYYPWYGSPHHERWTRQTKAVNSITVDGEGQKGRERKAKGHIVEFSTGRDFDYAIADATPAYMGRLTKFHRHVLHVRPGIFVIVDELAAPGPVTFDWWLHSLEKMTVDSSSQQVAIHRGNARLQATFVAPQSLSFRQTDQFDPPPERGGDNQWHLTASTANKATTATFFVVLSPYCEKAPEDVRHAAPKLETLREKDTIGVRWEENGQTQRIVFQPSGGRLSAETRRGGKVIAAQSWPAEEKR